MFDRSSKLKYLTWFFKLETASSIILGASLIVALILANVSATQDLYVSFLHANLAGLTIHEWINDALMAIFFYTVGMEIKREMISGSLSTVKKAMLPVFAAIGGMIVPAGIFLIVNTEVASRQAWGIPMATDIAFAIGALVATGKFAPAQLRSLLLALAVIDDLGAILVIAVFYSSGVSLIWLAAFCIVAALNFTLNKKLQWRWSRHLILGVLAWTCMLYSGVHATLAGVVWGFLTPFDRTESAPLNIALHKVHPFVAYFILPIFALANSGVNLPGLSQLPSLLSDNLLWAIVLGLFVGKPLGITLASYVCLKVKLAELPSGIQTRHLVGLGLIAGIGFTMALFIAGLSLTGETQLSSAKIGILFGSLISALAGAGFFMLTTTTPKSSE